MQITYKNYKALWMEGKNVHFIEQNLLPFEFKIHVTTNYIETSEAIKTMIVRGAGAIGNAGAYAMAQAVMELNDYDFLNNLEKAKKIIDSSRPTAQNLFWATQRVFEAAKISKQAAFIEAEKIIEDDIAASRKIAEFGNELIKDGYRIETHCNAGWLAYLDYGTALASIYLANEKNKNIFVYVDETRPRSQGARLTAWELSNCGVPNMIIPDNAGAYLMSLGKIDMMIVGADRIARNGDVANKIGTLEKAIAAKEFNIPFYVAAPSCTFDINCLSGKDIPIEERSEDEVHFQSGPDENNHIRKILVCSPGSKAFNPAFDVTPAKYITGIITEKGIIKPCENEVLRLFR